MAAGLLTSSHHQEELPRQETNFCQKHEENSTVSSPSCQMLNFILKLIIRLFIWEVLLTFDVSLPNPFVTY